MHTSALSGLAVARRPVRIPDPLVVPSPGHVAGDRTAWGSCEIRLVADRVASLRTGSTHKVYRDWRIEATFRAGHVGPCPNLFAVPIDPVPLAGGGSRYAMVQLTSQGGLAPGGSAFSWSVSTVGRSDPIAAALETARSYLKAAGWTQDQTVPTHFAKTVPTALAHVLGDISTHTIGAPESPAESRPEPDQLPVARTAPPAVTGLDGWETDGGSCSATDRQHGTIP